MIFGMTPNMYSEPCFLTVPYFQPTAANICFSILLSPQNSNIKNKFDIFIPKQAPLLSFLFLFLVPVFYQSSLLRVILGCILPSPCIWSLFLNLFHSSFFNTCQLLCPSPLPPLNRTPFLKHSCRFSHILLLPMLKIYSCKILANIIYISLSIFMKTITRTYSPRNKVKIPKSILCSTYSTCIK